MITEDCVDGPAGQRPHRRDEGGLEPFGRDPRPGEGERAGGDRAAGHARDAVEALQPAGVVQAPDRPRRGRASPCSRPPRGTAPTPSTGSSVLIGCQPYAAGQGRVLELSPEPFEGAAAGRPDAPDGHTRAPIRSPRSSEGSSECRRRSNVRWRGGSAPSARPHRGRGARPRGPSSSGSGCSANSGPLDLVGGRDDPPARRAAPRSPSWREIVFYPRAEAVAGRGGGRCAPRRAAT